MASYVRLFALATAAPVAVLMSVSSVVAKDRGAAPPAANPATLSPGDHDAAVRAYWTPYRMLHAIPKDMRAPGKPDMKHHAAPQRKPRIFPGAGPTIDYDGSLAKELYPASMHREFPQTPLSGTSGQVYTTNRFYPQNDKKLYKVYPYATVGQLFFTEPSGDYVCSASVIRLSTIATAGHCVNDGNGNYYTNWLFVPAENGTKAPFGSWTWYNAITTSAWYSGGGGVPNEQDDAVILLNYQTYHHQLQALGSLVGYLGYEFDAPAPNAVTQIGYPCNLDSCADPIATYAQTYATGSNTYEWGTDSFGGASGGPELQDFGQAPAGIPDEPYGGNILVSSTSYTYSSDYQVDGASILYAPGQNGEYTFGDDLNFACSNGGC